MNSFFQAEIRVETEPFFVTDQSPHDDGQYLFGYNIRITNIGKTMAKLVRRYWRIIDADGVSREVEGEGVVGEQPVLEPKESFEYTSYCPLGTFWGTMEGHYTFVDEYGVRLNIPVPRFILSTSQTLDSVLV